MGVDSGQSMAALHGKLLLPAPPNQGNQRRLHLEPPDVFRDCKRLDGLMKSGRVGDALDQFDRMPRKNVVAWTSAVSGLTRNGRPEAAVAMFADVVGSGVARNDFTCNAALAACVDAGALRTGEQMHSLAVRAGFAGDAWIGSFLIELYARCGSLRAAKDVFDRMESADVVGYTSLISAYCRSGEFKLAVEALDQMLRQGLEPNEHTMTSILGASCPLVIGEQIHGYMIKAMGSPSQRVYSSSSLIDLYSRNGEFDMAKMVFDYFHCKKAVSWCSMMQLHIRDGRPESALQVFNDMISDGSVDPNEFAFSIALGTCGSVALGRRQLHSSAIKRKLTRDLRVSNVLLSMYGRSGLVREVEAVLSKMEDPDSVSWTAAISVNFQNGFGEKAIALLSQMYSKGLTPNDYAFSSVLSSCADLALLDQGRQRHCLALKLGCDSKMCTGNALINMYSKCGQIEPARLAFDAMDQRRDTTSWNSLIHIYAQHGDADQALQAFSEMCSRGSESDESTFLGVLAACNQVGLVNEGETFFRSVMVERHGVVTPSPLHYPCMVDMLGRSGMFDDALRLIKGMPSGSEPGALVWKTLLAFYKLHANLEVGKLTADRVGSKPSREGRPPGARPGGRGGRSPYVHPRI